MILALLGSLLVLVEKRRFSLGLADGRVKKNEAIQRLVSDSMPRTSTVCPLLHMAGKAACLLSLPCTRISLPSRPILEDRVLIVLLRSILFISVYVLDVVHAGCCRCRRTWSGR